MSTNRTINRFARTVAGCKTHDNVSVFVVPGSSAPVTCGDRGHFETRGGKRIWHPCAYARKGFGNMRYVHSTRRVEVGAAWLDSAIAAIG